MGGWKSNKLFIYFNHLVDSTADTPRKRNDKKKIKQLAKPWQRGGTGAARLATLDVIMIMI